MRSETTRLVAARDPLGLGLEAPLVEEYAPLGARLRVETNSADVLAVCRSSFAGYGGAGEGPARLLLRLLVDPRLDAGPALQEPVFRRQGGLFYVSAGGSCTAVADLARGFAAGFFSSAAVRDAHFFRRTFVECLALTLLTHGPASTHSCVHASAVARAGRGVLFSGAARSGKSTLAYACGRRGLDLVSDDVVYLERREGDLVAWGKPWRLRLLPGSETLFPELSGQGELVDDCTEFDASALLPGRVVPRCRPAALLFLERSAGRAEIAPIERQAALELLARDLVADDPAVLERHGRLWLQAIDRGAYRLRSGSDLGALVDAVERFLDDRG